MSDIASPSLSLPLELVDTVTDYLAGDGDTVTLRNFSLANHHFAHTCRKHLFSTVRLVQTMKHGLFEERDTIYDHPLPSFKRLLQANPALASYVRDFELETMVFHDIPDDTIPPDYLDRVTSFTFGFSQGNRDSSTRRAWGTIPSITSFLDRNWITRIHLFGITRIPQSLFQSLPHLKALDIRNCSIDFVMTPGELDPATLPISLDSLGLLCEIHQSTRQGFISSNVFDISQLSKLHYIVPEDDVESIDSMGRVLSRIDKLRHLQIEFEEFSGSSIHDMIVRHLTSSSRESLRVVSVDVVVSDPMIEEFSPFAGLEEELKQLSTSNSLEEISLSIFLSRNDALDTDRETWFIHEAAFATGFPRLRKLDLTIEVGIYSPDEKVVEKTRNLVQHCLDQSLVSARNHSGLVVTSKVEVTRV